MSVLHANVPARYAFAAVALALGVSVVAGRESRPAPPPAAEAPSRPPSGPPAPPLELDKLERPGLGELQANLFATPRRATPRAAAPVPAAPPAPVLPPLPYRYLGRYVEADRAAVYLARGDEPVLAAPGATLPGGYRVEAVSPEAVTLIYVPLGERQWLPIPSQP